MTGLTGFRQVLAQLKWEKSQANATCRHQIIQNQGPNVVSLGQHRRAQRCPPPTSRSYHFARVLSILPCPVPTAPHLSIPPSAWAVLYASDLSHMCQMNSGSHLVINLLLTVKGICTHCIIDNLKNLEHKEKKIKVTHFTLIQRWQLITLWHISIKSFSYV